MDVNPNARAPLQGGSVTAPAQFGYLGKSITGMVGFYRYLYDRKQAMRKAVSMLRGQPAGTAVIITATAVRWGNRELGGGYYKGMFVGRSQSLESALRFVNGDHIAPTGEVSDYYIVYTGNHCHDGRIKGQPKTHMRSTNACPPSGQANLFTIEQANRI